MNSVPMAAKKDTEGVEMSSDPSAPRMEDTLNVKSDTMSLGPISEAVRKSAPAMWI